METQLADVKAELKSRKEEARLMIEEMEKIGRDLASRENIPLCQPKKKVKYAHCELFLANRDACDIQATRMSKSN
jgi:hypothetical protein